MPGRTAFICAMPMELGPLRSKLSLRKVRAGSSTYYEGSLGGQPVVAVATGMGTALAAKGTRCLLDAVDVERVVVVGITGAVDSGTPIGTLVLPEAVVDGATGTEYRPERLGDTDPKGKMWTSDALITDVDVIGGLRAEGVVSLDMETAAIAEVCEDRTVPWSVYRVVSDRAADGGIDAEVFGLSNQDGTPDLKAVVAYLVKHPTRLAAMVRLAKGASLATRRAAAAATDAVSRAPRPG